jgi:hypothetical protein
MTFFPPAIFSIPNTGYTKRNRFVSTKKAEKTVVHSNGNEIRFCFLIAIPISVKPDYFIRLGDFTIIVCNRLSDPDDGDCPRYSLDSQPIN